MSKYLPLSVCLCFFLPHTHTQIQTHTHTHTHTHSHICTAVLLDPSSVWFLPACMSSSSYPTMTLTVFANVHGLCSHVCPWETDQIRCTYVCQEFCCVLSVRLFFPGPTCLYCPVLRCFCCVSYQCPISVVWSCAAPLQASGPPTFCMCFCLLRDFSVCVCVCVCICVLSLIHIWRCRRLLRCRSRWSPYH